MSRIPINSAPLTNVGQAAYYNSRDRMRSLRDPTSELYKTTDLPRVAGVIDTDAFFPDADRELGFTIALTATPLALGVASITLGAVTPLILEVNDNDVIVRAGGLLAADSVSETIADILNFGLLHRLVMGVLPGTGQLIVWLDGEEKGRFQSTNQTFNGPWSDGADGAIAVTAPTVLATVEAYTAQLPQQF